MLAAILAIALLLTASAAVAQNEEPVPSPPAEAPPGGPQGEPAPEPLPDEIPPGAPPAEAPPAEPLPGETAPGAPSAEPPPEGAEAPPEAPFLSMDNVVGVVDRTHETVATTLNKTVAWFDSFFSDRRFLAEGTPESFFRLRTGARYEEREGVKALFRFHASLVMPRAKRRLRLVFEGKGEAERTTVLPVDPTTPEFAADQERQGSLQAVYDFIERADINLSIRPGVRFRFPVDPFLKVRLRYQHALGKKSLFRLTQEGFVTVQEGLGETTTVDLDRHLGPKTVLRWTTSGTLAETNTGYLWGSELSLLRQLTPRTAVTVEGGVSGQVRPVAVFTNYVTRIRFRQNLFRPWFFYEIEPELSWPRDENGAYPSTWAITLLVEFQFGRRMEASKAVTPP